MMVKTMVMGGVKVKVMGDWEDMGENDSDGGESGGTTDSEGDA